MRRGIAVLLTLSALAVPAGAQAAVLGAPLTRAPDAGGAPCPGAAPACALVLAQTASGTGATPDAPVAVTSWRARLGAGGGGTYRLAVVTPEGTGWRVLARSAPEALPSGTSGPRPAALHVPPGARLALEGEDVARAVATGEGRAEVAVAGAPAAVLDGEVQVAAEVEPDADADGLGDLTADPCPCTAGLAVRATAPRFAVAGEAVPVAFEVVQQGPDRAPDAVLTVTLPAEAVVDDVPGCTREQDVLTCALGDLAPASVARIALVVRPGGPGVVGLAARVRAAGTQDPAPLDDLATTATTVTPPNPAVAPVPLPSPACAWQVRGTVDDDVLTGTAFGDRLVGLAGSDLLRGRGGDDCLEGGVVRDVLAGGPGDDRLLGGPGRDRLLGEEGDDVLLGGRDADVLLGGAGDDVLEGGPGRDRLECGPGSDRAVLTKGDRAIGCERVQRR